MGPERPTSKTPPPQTCWSLISLHGVQTDPVQNSCGSSYFPDLVKNLLEDGRTSKIEHDSNESLEHKQEKG